jgi:hypothetical protein
LASPGSGIAVCRGYTGNACLKITPHSIAVLQILLAVMISEVLFFAQYLTLKEPYGSNDIDQEDPIREQEELTQQDQPECHVDRISTESKDGGCYQFVGGV